MGPLSGGGPFLFVKVLPTEFSHRLKLPTRGTSTAAEDTGHVKPGPSDTSSVCERNF